MEKIQKRIVNKSRSKILNLSISFDAFAASTIGSESIALDEITEYNDVLNDQK